MGRVKQVFVDLELDDPDQEYTETEIRAVAVPALAEMICYLLGIVCCLVWLAIGSTGVRI